jgi:cholesterol transport system auxiliary component
MSHSKDKASIDRRRLLLGVTAVGTSTLVLSACTLGDIVRGGEAPPQLFLLTPKSTFSDDLPRIESQLVIEVPIVSEGLDTHRIALRRSAFTLDYYASARWTERAPRLVQTMLVESFENTSRIVSVARRGTDLRADYTLKTELREFQAEYGAADAPGTVRVRLNAKIVALPRRAIIASVTVERTVDATGTNMEDVVEAFDEALGKVMRSVIEWTLEIVDAHETRANRDRPTRRN